jgi:hypothetical protein
MTDEGRIEYLKSLRTTELVTELLLWEKDRRQILEELARRAPHYDHVDDYLVEEEKIDTVI